MQANIMITEYCFRIVGLLNSLKRKPATQNEGLPSYYVYRYISDTFILYFTKNKISGLAH